MPDEMFSGASIVSDDDSPSSPWTITITLDREEYDRLLLMMGFAVGAAFKQDEHLAYRFLDLANRVNRNNPHWRPYEIPPYIME
jgi:hypothetical protein